jgi:hypothetical protein
MSPLFTILVFLIRCQIAEANGGESDEAEIQAEIKFKRTIAKYFKKAETRRIPIFDAVLSSQFTDQIFLPEMINFLSKKNLSVF